MVPGLVSHLDIQWQQTGYRRFVRALERGGSLIRLDKRGTGLSDPAAELPTTQERLRDVASVMAAAKSSRAVLFGLSDGGRAAIAFAAAYPGRTQGLILDGTSLRQGPPRHRPAHFLDLRFPYHAVVTIRLASDGPQTLHADTIGAAWLAVAGRILAEGIASRYDGLAVREISLVTLAVARPDPVDEIIASRAEPGRLAWMHANFTDHATVAALGGVDSYATRLFDYEHSGRDQVAWVVDRLRRDPAARSAAITTFQPLTDTSYIPCVSLLDFWLPDGAVELIAYAHSIDFGAKGYGNLVELAALQQHVAGQLGRPAGRLLMVVKSAHVYETERAYLLGVLADDGGVP